MKTFFKTVIVLTLITLSFSCEDEHILIEDSPLEESEVNQSSDKSVGKITFKAKEGAT